MERTISGMMGKGSVNHNTRAFTAKNVDKERSRDNVEFCHSDIKEVYHNLFDEALERYNAKQKRSDRKIDDYYEKIRRGKQEKLFYEAMSWLCGGRRESTSSSSPPTPTRPISITTFITIPLPLTVPINTGISSAPAVPSGGCPTPSVWKTASLS